MMISLSNISQFISVDCLFFLLIIGTIGNSLNLITLFAKDFRTNASIFYLIWATSSNQVFITFGIICRYLTEYNGSNLVNTNLYICKIRNHLLLFLPLTSILCAFFASFDRCASTSSNNRWRQLSSIRLARHLCPAGMAFFAISSSFSLFVFGIYNGKCTPSAGFGSIITNIYTSVSIFCVPIAGISTCGFLTWLHLKQSRNRIQATSSSTNETSNNRRMNRQLLILTFVQGSLFTVTYSLRWFTYDYNIATAFEQKSIERQQIEYLVLQVSLAFMYTSHGISFYLNYILCNGFRKKFHAHVRNLTDQCFKRFKCSKA